MISFLKILNETNTNNQIWYHGTNELFDHFDIKYFGKTDEGWFGVGFYFHSDRDTANVYGKNVIKAKLKTNKILKLPVEQSGRFLYEKLKKLGMELPLEFKKYSTMKIIKNIGKKKFSNFIKNYYDVMIVNYSQGTQQAIVFNKNVIKIIKTLNETINKQLYKKTYFNRINEEGDGLLEKVKNLPNFAFVLGVDVKRQACGFQNRCETNAYNFVKSKLQNNETNYFPVGGYMFVNRSLFPIEHWWVYDKNTGQHIEITPLDGVDVWCYAGVINFDINDKILNSNEVWDVNFFKGGHVYFNYFK